MELSLLESSSARIMIKNSEGGTSIRVFLPRPQTIGNSGSIHSSVARLHGDRAEDAVVVASLKAESALTEQSLTPREIVQQGGINAAATVDVVAQDNASVVSVRSAFTDHEGEGMNLALLPTMHQRLLTQAAVNEFSLVAHGPRKEPSPDPTSRTVGGIVDDARDPLGANAPEISRLKGLERSPVSCNVEIGLQKSSDCAISVGRDTPPDSTLQWDSASLGPMVDSGKALAAPGCELGFECNQPRAVALIGTQIGREADVPMDVDVNDAASDDALDIYGDECNSEPRFSHRHAAAISHDVSAHKVEDHHVVRENPCGPSVREDESSLSGLAGDTVRTVDTAQGIHERKVSHKVQADAILHFSSPVGAGPPVAHEATRVLASAGKSGSGPAKPRASPNLPSSTNITAINKRNMLETPVLNSVPVTALPVKSGSKKGNTDVNDARKPTRSQDENKGKGKGKDQAMTVQAKIYAEPVSVAVSPNNASSALHASPCPTPDISNGSNSGTDGINGPATMTAATTGLHVQVEERWARLRQSYADLKRQKDELSYENRGLLQANGELQKKVEGLQKELEVHKAAITLGGLHVDGGKQQRSTTRGLPAFNRHPSSGQSTNTRMNPGSGQKRKAAEMESVTSNAQAPATPAGNVRPFQQNTDQHQAQSMHKSKKTRRANKKNQTKEHQ